MTCVFVVVHQYRHVDSPAHPTIYNEKALPPVYSRITLLPAPVLRRVYMNLPVILSADSFDLVKLLVQVAQPRHRALRDKKYSGLRVSLLQKNLHDAT